MIDWLEIYLTHRQLRDRILAAHPHRQLGLQVFRRAKNAGVPWNTVSKEAETLGIRLDQVCGHEDFEPLRSAWEALDEGRRSSEPLPSVFAAALAIEPFVEHGADYLFRGQRRADWPRTPSIFRTTNNAPITPDLLQERIVTARQAVAGLRPGLLELSDLDRLAVARHHSAELGAGTWLLDFTKLPWVALFFASIGSCDSDVGVVDILSKSEWSRFGASPGDLGGLRVTQPANARRIQAQEAVFLESLHPALYEQLVPQRLYFRQQAGVVFTDNELTPPISEPALFPHDDRVKAQIHQPSGRARSRPLPREPGTDTFESPSALTYWRIVRQLVVDASPPLVDFARGLCDLQVALNAHPGLEEHPELRSLAQLRSLARSLVTLPDLDPPGFLEDHFYSQTGDEAVLQALGDCVSDARLLKRGGTPTGTGWSREDASTEESPPHLVIGVFGSSDETRQESPPERNAREIGRDLTIHQNLVVLSGGDDPMGRGVKNKVLSEARRWIGVTQRALAKPRDVGERGLELPTDLGHSRNFLEACLVDAAIALPGGDGTVSEVVFSLCLGKTVFLVGDWAKEKPDSWGILRPLLSADTTTQARSDAVNRTRRRIPRREGRAIDSLINDHLRPEALHGAHLLLRHEAAWTPALVTTVFRAVEPSRAFPALGDAYIAHRDRFEEFVETATSATRSERFAPPVPI